MKRNWYPISDNSKYLNNKFGVSTRALEKESPVYKASSFEEGLAQALKQRQEMKTVCEHCKSRRITYQGLGIYICCDCNGLTKTNYGKVREYLENKGSCTMIDLIGGTGLTKSDIDTLIQTGSIEYRNGLIGISS